MSVELKVPEVGESVTEVEVGRWLIEEGAAVKKDEPLVEIETDKVTLELPAPVDGRVSKRIKQQGDAAEVGEVIGVMEEGEGEAESGEEKHKAGARAEGESAKADSKGPDAETATATAEGAEKKGDGRETAAGGDESGDGTARVMPAARRLLEEHDLRPEDVKPSGPGGRLLKEDVQRHVDRHEQKAKEQAEEQTTREAEAAKTESKPSEPKAAPSGDREEQLVPMSPMRRKIAARLVEAQQTAALLTTFNEIDMTAVMELRNRFKEPFQEKHRVKLGFMSFFVKASIDALKQYPAVNAEVRGHDIVYKNYFDIGIAVGSGKGLVVPVLRDADQLSFAEIEIAIGQFVEKIKNNKLTIEELQGGTFTITNGGVYGSLLSTPIINPPQTGVLGMHAIQQRPMVVGDEVKPRPMMYVALTYDHRVVDGREAVSFLRRIKEAIEDPTRMLMEV